MTTGRVTIEEEIIALHNARIEKKKRVDELGPQINQAKNDLATYKRNYGRLNSAQSWYIKHTKEEPDKINELVNEHNRLLDEMNASETRIMELEDARVEDLSNSDKTHYDLLGVSREALSEDINEPIDRALERHKKVNEIVTAIYHARKNSNAPVLKSDEEVLKKDEEVLKKIDMAQKCLKSDEARKGYDDHLDEKLLRSKIQDINDFVNGLSEQYRKDKGLNKDPKDKRILALVGAVAEINSNENSGTNDLNALKKQYLSLVKALETSFLKEKNQFYDRPIISRKREKHSFEEKLSIAIQKKSFVFPHIIAEKLNAIYSKEQEAPLHKVLGEVQNDKSRDECNDTIVEMYNISAADKRDKKPGFSLMSFFKGLNRNEAAKIEEKIMEKTDSKKNTMG